MHCYNFIGNDPYICSHAIHNTNIKILEWLLKNGFETNQVYVAAAYKRNTKAIILLLNHNIYLSKFDTGYIKHCLNEIEDNEDVKYILDRIN